MEDLPELVDFMLQRLNKDQSTGTTEISKEAMDLLREYDWPGNVRELENVLQRALVLSSGSKIMVGDIMVDGALQPADSSAMTTASMLQQSATA